MKYLQEGSVSCPPVVLTSIIFQAHKKIKATYSLKILSFKITYISFRIYLSYLYKSSKAKTHELKFCFNIKNVYLKCRGVFSFSFLWVHTFAQRIQCKVYQTLNPFEHFVYFWFYFFGHSKNYFLDIYKILGHIK